MCGPITCPPFQKENSDTEEPLTEKVVEDSVTIECKEGFIFKEFLTKAVTATCVENDKVATWVLPGGGSEQNVSASCVPGKENCNLYHNS